MLINAVLSGMRCKWPVWTPCHPSYTNIAGAVKNPQHCLLKKIHITGPISFSNIGPKARRRLRREIDSSTLASLTRPGCSGRGIQRQKQRQTMGTQPPNPNRYLQQSKSRPMPHTAAMVGVTAFYGLCSHFWICFIHSLECSNPRTRVEPNDSEILGRLGKQTSHCL